MPCFFRFASQFDQNEIEKHAKESMYFYAQVQLYPEQLKEFEALGLPKFSEKNLHEDLCKLCTILTEFQMKNVSAYYHQIKWAHETLHDWYMQHQKDDKYHQNFNEFRKRILKNG